MSKNEKWFLFFANFSSIVTGLALAWMIFILSPANEWDVFNHPWQKNIQALHILVVPLLLFSIGIIWKKHIQERFFKKNQPYKLSGWALILILFPMVFSGYLIQVSVEEQLRLICSQIHLWTSLAWTIVFMVHMLKFF